MATVTYHDLSRPIETGMQVFPGDPAVDVEAVAAVDADGYRVSAVHCGSHTGTHVDAPSHTEPDGAAIDDYPLEAFVFDARVVDVRGAGAREPIGPEQLPGSWDGDLLVLRTGWADHWGTDRYLDHPYLAPAAAERCAAEGWSVAVDALNPDPTPTAAAGDDEPEGVPAHHALLGAGLFIVENLAGLDGLDRGTLYAFPLPLAGCDGAPVRAVFETDGE